jgi:hypothetical protein
MLGGWRLVVPTVVVRLDSVNISIVGFEMSHTLRGEQVHVVLWRLQLFTSIVLGL